MMYSFVSGISLLFISSNVFTSQEFDLHKYHAAFGSTRPITRAKKTLSHDELYKLHEKYLNQARLHSKYSLNLDPASIFPNQPTMIRFCNTTSLFQNLGTKLKKSEIRQRISDAFALYASHTKPTVPELKEISQEEKNIITAIECFQKQHRCGKYRPKKQ